MLAKHSLVLSVFEYKNACLGFLRAAYALGASEASTAFLISVATGTSHEALRHSALANLSALSNAPISAESISLLASAAVTLLKRSDTRQRTLVLAVLRQRSANLIGNPVNVPWSSLLEGLVRVAADSETETRVPGLALALLAELIEQGTTFATPLQQLNLQPLIDR